MSSCSGKIVVRGWDKYSVFVRQCEFGRAALERALSGNQVPKIHYIGVMRADMKPVMQDLEQRIYKWWDESSESGPKVRPRSDQERPTLSVLRWAGSVPNKLPEQVLNNFSSTSIQHAEIVKYQAKLESLWPDTPTPPPSSDANSGTVRTSCLPDLTDAAVLDLSREISAAHISSTGFDVPRQGLIGFSFSEIIFVLNFFWVYECGSWMRALCIS